MSLAIKSQKKRRRTILKDEWAFCKAIVCEHFREFLPDDKRCGVKLEPFDCEDCMDEVEAEKFRLYLEERGEKLLG
jgi:hypothetical protein